MQEVQEKTTTGQGYNLHVIQSTKYKTVNIVVKFKAPLERETITKRAILPYVLQQGTEKNPNARSLRQALDALYGAVLSIDGSKKGEQHILTARLEVANEAYLTNESKLLDQAVQLLSEIVFKPKTDGQAFDTKIVNREKETLKQKMEAIKDDKMSYANMRLMDEMCKEEPYHLHVHGYQEDLNSLDESSLYQYYHQLLQEDQMDIYLLGDFSNKQVEDIVHRHFDRKDTASQREQTAPKQKDITKVQEIVDQEDVQQGKLHLGYRTNITYNDSDYAALQVFNGIFGGFPSSKLFINVREKNSLAYYAASRVESHKGLLLVFSGINPADYQKAKDIMLEQMEAMKQGEFTEQQVEEVKSLVVSQFLETMDHPVGLIEVMYHQVIAGSDINPNELLEQVKQVKKEDVVRAANKVDLDTVYFLTSKGGCVDA
ncbi:insulinase family protein [Radiobacillus kanasensis]|uniref:EF-P 5-aminopentanol modification-associated protein YfmF n=1 Tax=Radiobacillus kanasensis TaxID=2844358 RepID=UPI001E62A2F0|nr:pitrilysin family protein [Radiobacillus kanasensis]UFU01095.1 insulinase family protein [Radiobacillus kanasensis]